MEEGNEFLKPREQTVRARRSILLPLTSMEKFPPGSNGGRIRRMQQVRAWPTARQKSYRAEGGKIVKNNPRGWRTGGAISLGSRSPSLLILLTAPCPLPLLWGAGCAYNEPVGCYCSLINSFGCKPITSRRPPSGAAFWFGGFGVRAEGKGRQRHRCAREIIIGVPHNEGQSYIPVAAGSTSKKTTWFNINT